MPRGFPTRARRNASQAIFQRPESPRDVCNERGTLARNVCNMAARYCRREEETTRSARVPPTPASHPSLPLACNLPPALRQIMTNRYHPFTVFDPRRVPLVARASALSRRYKSPFTPRHSAASELGSRASAFNRGTREAVLCCSRSPGGTELAACLPRYFTANS